MKKYLLALVAMIPMCVSAGFYDGNKLDLWSLSLDKANRGDSLSLQQAMDASVFQGYIAAVSDLSSGVIFCPTSEVALKQLTDIVSAYLKKYPEKRADNGSDIVLDALSEKFPCIK
ncbi:Rap1a/Tai family immunity protein [Providencia sp. PROV239]|uniref:Rap1a/Tai family immunity protein n=1 Tax=Providencia sp. PROV239 TaxID=2949930 RepID=UPI002349547B|nr:Rap1a/Tai family immunity protein [Providencia sp. PROV239]